MPKFIFKSAKNEYKGTIMCESAEKAAREMCAPQLIEFLSIEEVGEGVWKVTASDGEYRLEEEQASSKQ